MLIHFICTGNSYRSRLAEAYLNSKLLPDIKAISSGISASVNRNGPVGWLAARLFIKYSLIKFISMSWTQTSKENLDKSDLVIFMTDFHLEYAIKNFGYTGKIYEVWGIKDIDEYGLSDITKSDEEDLKVIKLTESTFMQIKSKVDDLLSRIS